VSKPNGNGQAQYINDMPRKELRTVQDVLPEVVIRIRRKTPQGSFVMLPQQIRPVEELLNGKWDLEIAEKAGGGEYEFTVLDPGTSEAIAPTWRQRYPGSPNLSPFKDQAHLGFSMAPGQQQPGAPMAFGPLAAPRLGAPLAGFGGMPGVAPPTVYAGIQVPQSAWTTPGVATPMLGPDGRPLPPPPGTVPAQVLGLPVETQWGIYYTSLQAQGRLPQGASMHSDALASKWAERFDGRQQSESAENKALREQIAELRADRERAAASAETRMLAGQFEALKMQLLQQQQGGGANMQLELARMQQQAQMQAQQQQMQMMMMMMEQRNQPQKTPDWGAVLAGLGAIFGPLVTAYFSSASQRQANEVQAQIKQMELSSTNNTSLVQTLLAASSQKSDVGSTVAAVLGAAAPIVGPLLLQWLENRSPETLLAVQQGTVQGQMMMTKMVTEFIDQMTKDNGGDRPWWAPMLEGLVHGVQDAAPIIASLVQSQGQPALPGGAPKAPPAQQQTTTSTQTSAPQGGYAPMSWDALEKLDPQAAQVVKQVYALLPANLGFHTDEWRILLFNFHRRVEPEAMADLLLTHLENCKNFGTLPVVLQNVEADPEQLRPFLMGLPIGRQDPAYASAVIDIVVSAIRGDDDDSPAPQAQGEGTVVAGVVQAPVVQGQQPQSPPTPPQQMEPAA
jgi:hypothetical protein